jgi:ribosomal protein S18 acetylase RimI-like enzyme
VRLEPSSGRSLAELAAIFNAGYEGYFTPVNLDESVFGQITTAWDIDLDASRVAVDGDEPVGIVNVGLRGEDAWIGGVGVAGSRRGSGIGKTLMHAAHDAARAAGAGRVWLEVLVENTAAIRLYEKLGYEHVRDLEVWALDELVSDRHKLPSLPLQDALGREERPPWQRADATVAHGEAEAIGDERDVLVFRRAPVAALLQCAAEGTAAARGLVESLPADVTAVRWLNGPDGHPLNDALAELGGTLAHRQHELVLEL